MPLKEKLSLIVVSKVMGILMIAGIGAVIIITDILISYRDFSQSADQMRKEYLGSQKRIAKQEVMQVVDLIKYKKAKSEEVTKNLIKARVYEAYNVASDIYNLNKDSKSSAEIKNMIIEVLRSTRFNQNKGYYFIDDLAGIAILNSEKSDLEGKSLADFQDKQGKYVFKEMLDIVEQSNEGFIDYFWYKPDAGAESYKKVSFVKRFEPFDWIIGTGLYTDDAERHIKQELLSDISRIRFGEEGYIFVHCCPI